MPIYAMQNSFGGGEFAPAMYGRTDLQKYAVAARQMENFFVHPHGGASNRPGTEYISSTKYAGKKSRLVPFKFSVEQAYMLEFGHQYIRFYMDGGQITTDGSTPYEVATTYTEDELPYLKFTQSADVLYICDMSHKPATLTRTGHTAWVLADFVNGYGPFLNENLTDTTITPSAVTGTITLNASGAVFKSGHVGALFRVSHNMEGEVVSSSFTAIGTSGTVRTNDTWKLVTHGTWTGKIKLQKSIDGGTTWTTYRVYASNADNNVADSDTVEETTLFRVVCYSYTSGTINFDLSTFPYTIDGIAKVTAVTDSTHATATVVSEMGATTATKYWSEGAWSEVRGYPGAVGFFQNRIVFGGTTYEPQTGWLSQSGDYPNFKVSSPVEDSDAVTVPLVSRSVNQIRSIVAMKDILMLTAAAEWIVNSGGSNSGVITPTAINATAQGYRGSSIVDPCIVGNRVLFIQEMGSTVRDLGYDWSSDSYTGNDCTLLARHLFQNHTIVSWAYQQEPDSIIWAVRDDGVLLGFTYLKEQEVWAWHRHITDGKVESVATIPGDNTDEVWFIVNRAGGRFVERMAARMTSTEPKDQWFVDAGLCYEGSSATIISGLDHLKGQTVAILADGNVMPKQVVSDTGVITLPSAYSKVIVGLPYTCTLETLDVEFQGRDGTIQGRKKRISRAIIRVENTRGGWVGTSVDRLTEMKMRSNEAWGDPIALFSGDKDIAINSGYSIGGRITIQQKDPLPITVLAIIMEVDFGGA